MPVRLQAKQKKKKKKCQIKSAKDVPFLSHQSCLELLVGPSEYQQFVFEVQQFVSQYLPIELKQKK